MRKSLKEEQGRRHISEGASVEILCLTWLLPDIAPEILKKEEEEEDTPVLALVLVYFLRVICPSSRSNYLEANVLVSRMQQSFLDETRRLVLDVVFGFCLRFKKSHCLL